MKDDILRFPSAVRHDPAIDVWLGSRRDDLRPLAEAWFLCMRQRGDEVRELMHDGCPTACVGDAAFGYVNAFRDHVNVGFFFGSLLMDPASLLEGTGKRGRHVKLRPGREIVQSPCATSSRHRPRIASYRPSAASSEARFSRKMSVHSVSAEAATRVVSTNPRPESGAQRTRLGWRAPLRRPK